MDPEGVLDSILDLCLQKVALERPKKDQEASKSVRKTFQSEAKSSQMVPKTLQNQILKRVFSFHCPIPNLHRFFIDFLLISCKLLKAAILQNHAKT